MSLMSDLKESERRAKAKSSGHDPKAMREMMSSLIAEEVAAQMPEIDLSEVRQSIASVQARLDAEMANHGKGMQEMASMAKAIGEAKGKLDAMASQLAQLANAIQALQAKPATLAPVLAQVTKDDRPRSYSITVRRGSDGLLAGADMVSK